jgi:hypothetical protein
MPTYQAGPVDAQIHNFLNVFRNNAFAGFATPYIGFLATGPVTSDGAGAVEIAANADYVRKPLTSTILTAPAARAMNNNADILFIASTTVAWNGGSPIAIFGIWSQLTPVGPGPTNLLWADEIIPPFVVGSTPGSTVTIKTPNLILRSNPRPVTY